jgi:protocatechuate 3,4-dioxygenase beta subunit
MDLMPSRRALLMQAGSALIVGPAAAKGAALRFTQPLTMGPFYPLTKPADQDNDLTRVQGHKQRASGQTIEVSGRVLNTRGQSVPEARIEVWQANAAGRYFHPSDANPAPLDPNFQGYASFRADRAGNYRYLTVKPGAYPGPRGVRTPHIHLDVDGRIDRLVTQMFFPNESLNATDIIMRDLANPATGIAVPAGLSAAGVQRFKWDIILNTG